MENGEWRNDAKLSAIELARMAEARRSSFYEVKKWRMENGEWRYLVIRLSFLLPQAFIVSDSELLSCN
jgi:hypothetical protein